MQKDLLIHSMASFSSITLAILEAVKPSIIAEIGAEHGGNSKLLYDWLKDKNGKLISIDCNPSQVFIDWIKTTNGIVQHVQQESLRALPDIHNVDAWFIDGDHNWYTVYNELKLIRELNQKQNKNTLIFFHDVSWPWARRDLYYSPDRIPADFRHPLTWEGGVTLDNPDVIDGGFQGCGAYAIALKEGGKRNGVLTAIEDFIREFTQEYCYAQIPAVFGLGVLFNLHHPQAEEIATIVTPYHHNSLLQLLERNRLDNYLRVIELQNENAALTNQPKPEPAQTSPQSQLTDWETEAVSLINTLNDHANDPDIFDNITAKLPNDKNKLKQLSSYLNMLLAIPQEKDAIKLISILEALSQAKSGNLSLAHKRLEELYANNPNCPLLLGAYKHTFSLTGQPT